MGLELMTEKWTGKIHEVSIGALKSEGGSRPNVVTVGGQSTLPFLFPEGSIPHKPVIAYEIWDVPPDDWPEALNKEFKSVYNDPLAWAEKCVKEYKAQLLCLKLQGAHPEFGNKKPEQEGKLIQSLLKKVDVPLIILGCGDDAQDNLVLPVCGEAAHGERCLIGEAAQENYKTLAASVLADGHAIIAASPIDINIAKQLNILISDMGMPPERIVMNPTVGALGYGLEYTYSIMERARLAALCGDRMLASPFICFVGQETWKTKEAKALESEFPAWGEETQRGIIWESLTAVSLIQSGADIVVMRHPKSAAKVEEYINNLMKG